MSNPYKIIPPVPSFSLVLIAFYLLTHLAVFTSAPAPRTFPDSHVFTVAASKPLFSAEIWTGKRSPLTPLLYKIAGGKTNAIVWLQLLISMISWLLLAIAASAHATGSAKRTAAFAAILSFSLLPSVSLWNNVILSESLAISSLAFYVASWLFYLYKQSRLAFAGVIVSSLFFASVRDTNAYILLVPGFVLLIYAFYRKKKYLTQAAAISTVCMIVFLATGASADIGRRWVSPFYNVISQRILTDPKALSWFTERGMPYDNALSIMKGQWASSYDYAYYNDSRLEDFRQWTNRYGKTVYVKFLILHPAYLLLKPTAYLHTNFTAYLLDHSAPGYTPVMPFNYLHSRIHSWLFVLYFPAIILSLLTVLVRRKHGSTPIFWTSCLLIFTGLTHYLIAWHADAMETARHSLSASLQFRLGVLLLMLSVLNRNKKTAVLQKSKRRHNCSPGFLHSHLGLLKVTVSRN